MSLIDRDHATVWHPYTQMKTQRPPLAIARGEGVYLYTEDGRRILDGSGGAAVSCLGHQHPRVVDAIARQAARLAYAHTGFFTSEPASAALIGLPSSSTSPLSGFARPESMFISEIGRAHV
mgnify:CR=1 FL=1